MISRAAPTQYRLTSQGRRKSNLWLAGLVAAALTGIGLFSALRCMTRQHEVSVPPAAPVKEKPVTPPILASEVPSEIRSAVEPDALPPPEKLSETAEAGIYWPWKSRFFARHPMAIVVPDQAFWEGGAEFAIHLGLRETISSHLLTALDQIVGDGDGQITPPEVPAVFRFEVTHEILMRLYGFDL